MARNSGARSVQIFVALVLLAVVASIVLTIDALSDETIDIPTVPPPERTGLIEG